MGTKKAKSPAPPSDVATSCDDERIPFDQVMRKLAHTRSSHKFPKPAPSTYFPR